MKLPEITSVDGDSVRFKLVEKHGAPPPYAILSHRWYPDDDELTFEDMQNRTGQSKIGYQKVKNFLAKA